MKPLCFRANVFLFCLVIGCAAAGTVLAQSQLLPSVRQLMTPAEFRASGLYKLSDSELKALDGWLERFALVITGASSSASTPKNTYTVQAAANDETFIINGNVFEAKTYCFGIEKGDQVVFAEGSPNGACASAKFVVMRSGKSCDCWCK